MGLLRAFYPFPPCCVLGTGLKTLQITNSFIVRTSGATSLYFGKDLLVYYYINNFSKCCFPDPFFFLRES